MNLKDKLNSFFKNGHHFPSAFKVTGKGVLALLSILFLVAVILTVYDNGDRGDREEKPLPAEILEETPETPSVPEDDYSVGYLAGEVKPNQGPYQVVLDMNPDISLKEVLKVINVLRFNVEIHSIRAGEKIWVKTVEKPSEDDPTKNDLIISEFIYRPNSVIDHKVTLDEVSGELVYSMTERPTEFRYRVIEGTLEEGSSLNNMLLDSDVPPNLTDVVNGVLQNKISFRTHARAGDKYTVLLQERYYGDEWIDGSVLYTSYQGRRTGFHEAFQYSDADPKSSYNAHYTPDGEALISSGLRYPLDRLQIVSTYGMRMHPVTGQRQMHYGVDYRASIGTKVHAVAKGKVIVSSYDSVSGNKVAIQHSDGSSSWYLHLKTRSVKKGQQVQSRQVIGFSGNTGRVTGPHLHFAFKNSKNQWINPLTKRMIATPRLQGERLEQLQIQVQNIRLKLRDLGVLEETPENTSSLARNMK